MLQPLSSLLSAEFVGALGLASARLKSIAAGAALALAAVVVPHASALAQISVDYLSFSSGACTQNGRSGKCAIRIYGSATTPDASVKIQGKCADGERALSLYSAVFTPGGSSVSEEVKPAVRNDCSHAINVLYCVDKTKTSRACAPDSVAEVGAEEALPFSWSSFSEVDGAVRAAACPAPNWPREYIETGEGHELKFKCLPDKPTPGEIKAWVMRAKAEAGDAEAQINLGDLYHKGDDIPQDYSEAAKLYRLAAERGRADAQYNLGWMHFNGGGVSRDDSEAYVWFSLAAENGHLRASGMRYVISVKLSSDELSSAQEGVVRRRAAIKSGTGN